MIVTLGPMNLDLKLLKRQKLALLRAVRKSTGTDKVLLDGVLNMLDAIHDACDPPPANRK